MAVGRGAGARRQLLDRRIAVLDDVGADSAEAGYANGALAYYDMVLMPWLAYLRLRRDNYLFHGKNVLEQTQDIFDDYDVRDWAVDIQGQVPPVTDACQYDESDYNYLHRRWESLGWHYWYEHREDGHTLVLSDSTFRSKPIDGVPTVPWQNDTGSLDEDGIGDWTPVRRIVPAKVSLSSFDFKNPRPSHVDVPTVNQQGAVLPVEVYDPTLNYNRTRQAMITKELIEIISGAEAL